MTGIPEDLAELVRVTRVIGADPSLVLGGGGNSSVKTTLTDITGEPMRVIYIKGSGHDMATITTAGFAPLRLDRLERLLPPVMVEDERLLDELRGALVDQSAPDPSVETLLHVALPDAAVVHSHADSLQGLGDTPDGSGRIRSLLGDLVVVVDYAMPGPDLTAACQAAWRARRGDEVGLVVVGHGLFTVGATPAEALERHLAVVARATAALPDPTNRATQPDQPDPTGPDPAELARFRKAVCAVAGRPLVMNRHTDETVRAFIADPELLAATARGPVTPDHATRTKPTPMTGRNDLDDYSSRYQAYVAENRVRRHQDVVAPDPAPRVVLDPDWGLLSLADTAPAAATVRDIYRHTMSVIRWATALGGYEPAGLAHTFDLEFWGFQQGKARRARPAGDLAGQVALVTGAASGIGRACAARLLAAGASVVGWDLSDKVETVFDDPGYLGLTVDITDPAAMRDALARQVDSFGGLDILVPAAGIFPVGADIADLDKTVWRKTMAVNVDAAMELYHLAHPLLAAAVPYGRVALIASKNALAPGPGAAAYSVSKAGVTQLTRVAALEWAADGIRVNMIHPDGVFDTGLWTSELLETRAAHYGMTVDAYKRRNLLHAEITSATVAEMVYAMCGPAFASTTGAQVPLDGGSDRII